MTTKEGWEAKCVMLSQPLDLKHLLAQGILVKAGAYYRVRNIHELPEHVASRIVEIVRDAKGSKVKFGKV
jgi:hypothetical protein